MLKALNQIFILPVAFRLYILSKKVFDPGFSRTKSEPATRVERKLIAENPVLDRIDRINGMLKALNQIFILPVAFRLYILSKKSL